MSEVEEGTPREEESRAITVQSRLPIARNELAQNLLDLRERIRTLLRPGINFDQFIACCVQATNVLGLEPSEMANHRTKLSYAISVQNCAVLGLLPGSALGHAYFVPYPMNRGKSNEYQMIQLIPGYRGLLELAWGAGFLVNCDPEVVLEGESVERSHTTRGPQISHRIPIPRATVPDVETIMAAYCTYQPRGGVSVLGEVVEGSELKKMRSKAGPRSPWKTRYEAMCKKTAIRRTAKRWRQTQQLSWAVQLDEQAEIGEEQELIADLSSVEEVTIDMDQLPEGEYR